MSRTVRKADLALSGSSVCAVGGIGWCLYLNLAEMATPWFWITLVAGVLTASTSYALELPREKPVATGARGVPRRRWVPAFRQLLSFHALAAILAFNYSSQVLSMESAPWVFAALAAGCMAIAAVTFLDGLRDRDTRSTATQE